MFSKACEYGIRASIYIAEQSMSSRRASLTEIANAIESPSAYTSKILQKLTHHKIINSEKGPSGGFSMDKRKLENVRLSTIVFAIDGENIFNGCGLGLKKCNAKIPCPVHNQFKAIREKLNKMLQSTSIKSLLKEYEKGLTFLKQ